MIGGALQARVLYMQFSTMQAQENKGGGGSSPLNHCSSYTYDVCVYMCSTRCVVSYPLALRHVCVCVYVAVCVHHCV